MADSGDEVTGKRPQFSRRSLFREAGQLFVGASLLPLLPRSQSSKAPRPASTDQVMRKLSAYMSEAKDRALPDEVVEKAKQHVLDTFAAMVSGSELLPGREAIKFARAYGGKEVATVVASNLVCGPMEAALTNAMMAHADETDDSHAPSQSHPGCGIVPAAFAAGERFAVDGMHFLRAVTLGYDVGPRVTMTLGGEPYEFSSHHSTHSISNTFGASAAAACAAGLTARQMRWVLNYAAEQASGLALWGRSPRHVEKAFDFAGGPARDGVTAAMVVESGWTGIDDVFSGPNNFFLAFGPDADPEGLIDKLGSRYEVARTDIKRWSVGIPIQASLQALLNIRKQHPFSPDEVKEILVRLAPHEAAIVNNRVVPNICLQHIMAVMLADNQVTFHASHDEALMRNPAILRERAKIKLVPDEALGRLMPVRQSIVEVILTDGRSFRNHVVDGGVVRKGESAVLGTVANPMTNDDVKAKARELMLPVLGEPSTSRLMDRVFALESVKDIRELRGLLQKS
ncbi:MAG TPA: MmgE/PrpD family protein [Candidatus Dormibacteraeota bacterium]|nr:MmgE/PrpD family protein [Candidatus Dormibacteraeota bacterium]